MRGGVPQLHVASGFSARYGASYSAVKLTLPVLGADEDWPTVPGCVLIGSHQLACGACWGL